VELENADLTALPRLKRLRINLSLLARASRGETGVVRGVPLTRHSNLGFSQVRIGDAGV